MRLLSLVTTVAVWSIPIHPASAQPFFFSTGNPNGLLATASRPASPGKIAIASADDFALSSPTHITQATFTGLLPAFAAIAQVRIGIYRTFPFDSDVSRTSGPPNFSTTQVPVRLDSPSDVEFVGRSSANGSLSFSTTTLNPNFTAANSIVNGINPIPNQTTGGEGPVTGQEVSFTINFSSPFDLPDGHYFFAPQVELTGAGDFFWLSTSRPIAPPGTPFAPDFESWIRDENLAPDWLRIGTDIIGGAPAPTSNASFSLTGVTMPLPEPTSLTELGLVAIGLFSYRWHKRDDS